jgi:hypothetical protein
MSDRFDRHKIEMTKRGLATNSSSKLSSAGFQTLLNFLNTIWENLCIEAWLLGEKLEGNCVNTSYLFSIVLGRIVSFGYKMSSDVGTYLS